ncbi:SDR family oxidoreductase [Mangrovicoccus algicola]|uniref:SDR family oxidoreductase n=1 Tax=Mangrovicoccus algicola TaxID=2771008 RepID=A0A8J7CJF8_9RHOB|nr:SDR family oxidoreductase [Mangrovicoccus algicola]MBE3637621.1 SDR family oxidoreductase [Mangrovicoccus algicola]
MTEHVEIPPQSQARMPGDEYRMEPAPDYTPRHPGVGKLSGKVALITGGDSGIGRAVAVLFAREGARVAIAYLDEDRDAEETRRIVEEEEGSSALLIRGDLGNRDHARAAVERTVSHFGALDILVNNAAQQFIDEDFANLDEERLRRVLDAGVMSYIYCTQAALPHLKEGAAIINTTSVNAFKGNDSLIAYSTSRGASLALARSMAMNLAEKGIRVNAVAPGPVWTPFIPASMPAGSVEDFGSHTRLGRAAQPWEVATSYLFLASSDGSYFTGQTLHPNGGYVVGA